MKLSLDFSSKSEEDVPLEPGLMKSLVEKVVQVYLEGIKSVKLDKVFNVSLSFVSKDEIHRLNVEVFGRDRPTDVIAFPFYGSVEEIEKAPCPVVLGEIVICPEIARENSQIYGNSYERELALLVVHGTLHLLGLPDGDPVLEKLQEEIVSDFFSKEAMPGE